MKTRYLILIILIVLIASCSTTNPYRSDVSFPNDGNYRVLGRVTIEVDASKSGYITLLEAAKRQFPETNDVVNIIIDRKVTWLLYILPIDYELKMSGIAISYH